MSHLASQHRELLGVIEAGDPARAGPTVREHPGAATGWLTRQAAARQAGASRPAPAAVAGGTG